MSPQSFFKGSVSISTVLLLIFVFQLIPTGNGVAHAQAFESEIERLQTGVNELNQLLEQQTAQQQSAPLQSPDNSLSRVGDVVEGLRQLVDILQAQSGADIGTALTSNETPCTFTRGLEVGVEGNDVECLQMQLAKGGFFTVEPTGYFGPITKAAVTRWQQSQGLVLGNDYGLFGPISRAAFRRASGGAGNSVATQGNTNTAAALAELAELSSRAKALQQMIGTGSGDDNIISTQGTNSAPCTLSRGLQVGVVGSDVTCLQGYLRSEGHLATEPTGYFGPITKAAVTRWQQSQGLVLGNDYGLFGPISRAAFRRASGGAGNSVATQGNTNTAAALAELAELSSRAKALQQMIGTGSGGGSSNSNSSLAVSDTGNSDSLKRSGSNGGSSRSSSGESSNNSTNSANNNENNGNAASNNGGSNNGNGNASNGNTSNGNGNINNESDRGTSASNDVNLGTSVSASSGTTIEDCVEQLGEGGGWCELPVSISEVWPEELPPGTRGASGPGSVLGAWTGAAFDEENLRMYFHGGGHADYGGNEVYEFDFREGEWTRLTDPSPLSSRQADAGEGTACFYPEVGPSASHNYDGWVWDDRINKFYLFPGVNFCTQGMWWASGNVWTFDPEAREWEQLGEGTIGAGGHPRSALLPDGRIALGGDTRDGVYDPATNSWTQMDTRPGYGNGNMVYDPDRDLLWSIHRNGLLSASPGDMNFTKVSDSAQFVGSGSGMDYANGLLYFWDGGAKIHTYDPDTNEWEYFDWVGNKSTEGNLNKIYSKWAYVAEYDVFVGVSGEETGPFVYKHPEEGAEPNYAGRALVFDTLTTEAPTAHTISIHLSMQSGDANENGAVKVFYRKAGTSQWNESIELFKTRITEIAPYTGMLSNLEPDTTYEIRVVGEDPDGVEGSDELVVQATTLPIPLTLTEATADTVVRVDSASALQTAVNAATPGTLILVDEGTYTMTLNLQRTMGTAEQPIVVRGSGDHATILDGGGARRVVGVLDSEHVQIENFVLQNANIGIEIVDYPGDGTENVTVRNNLIRDITIGIRALEGHANLYITDNVLQGTNVFGDTSRATWNDEGIVVTGQGHEVAYNTLSGFGDSIGLHKTTDRPNIGIDIHHNLVLWGGDDGIEFDFTTRNVQGHHNLITNSANGLSFQNVHNGPAYAYKNVTYNTERGPYKVNPEARSNKGVFIMNNTTIKQGRVWLNGGESVYGFRFFNNLGIGDGTDADVVRLDTVNFQDLEWNNNAWNYDGRFQVGGEGGGNSNTFAIWKDRAPHGTNDVLLEDETIFDNITLDFDTRDFDNYRDPFTADFTLVANSSAVDAGMVIPSITDGYRGSAPDIGAIERGEGMPHYGARTNAAQAAARVVQVANDAPAANAGADITVTDSNDNGKESINLDGSGSTDTDGSIESYVWTLDGEEIAAGATPNNVPFDVGSHTVTLTVTDDEGATDTDTVTVDVRETVLDSSGNQAPLAVIDGGGWVKYDTTDAGTAQFPLRGHTSSDPDGSIVNYRWKKSDGTILYDGSGSIVPTNLPVGTHTITLTVTDDEGATATDTGTYILHDINNLAATAVPGNQAPTALVVNPSGNYSDAFIGYDFDGDGFGRISLTIDHANSDPDGDILINRWTETNGTVLKENAGEFYVEYPVGTHEVVLTVYDDGGASDSVTVPFTIFDPQNPPSDNIPPEVIIRTRPHGVANDSRQIGKEIILFDNDGDGREAVRLYADSSTDQDGTIAFYRWSGNNPLNTRRTSVADSTPYYSRIYFQDGYYPIGTTEMSVTVYDDEGAASSDTVTVTVIDPDNPEATAGEETQQTTRQTDHAFADKCNKDGVILCEGFENQAAVSAAYSGREWTIPAKYDPVEDAAKMFVPSLTPADSTGSFMFNFPAVRRADPGEQHIWVQYKVKYPQDFIDQTFYSDIDKGTQTSWKTSVMWDTAGSCSSKEFAIAGSKIIGGYTKCGAWGFQAPHPVQASIAQPGGDTSCLYKHVNPKQCLHHKGDTWATYTYHINLDTYFTEMWVKYDSDPYLYKVLEFTMKEQDSNLWYGNIYLSAYMTGKDARQEHPQYEIGYDNLIISTEPIALPEGDSVRPTISESQLATRTIVDFGASEAENVYGTSMTSPFKDYYESYVDSVVDGIARGDGGYAHSGVEGGNETFRAGEKIRVTFYNNRDIDLEVHPLVYFNGAGRGGDEPYLTDARVTIPANSSGYVDYTFTKISEGTYPAVKVSMYPGRYGNTDLIVDKIEHVYINDGSVQAEAVDDLGIRDRVAQLLEHVRTSVTSLQASIGSLFRRE